MLRTLIQFSRRVLPSQPALRAAGCLALLAVLSACASKPQLSARQEASQYLSRAHRTYTPPGPSSDPWGPYIVEASARFDVPERWIREVMRQESGGRLYNRSGDLITSGAGAMGLMQVLPGTYDEIRGRDPDLTDDPFDPHNNILAGTAYIREMYDIYGSPGFLAAYNAGPGRLDDYLTRNRGLPEETRRYVASIGPRLIGSEPNKPSPGEQYAMNSLPLDIPAGPRSASSARTRVADSRYSTPTPDSRYSTPTPEPRYTAGQAIVLNTSPIRPPMPFSPPVRETLRQPVQVAQLPEPPRPLPFQRAEPAPQRFAAAPAPRGFSLVSPAMAEPIRRGGPSTGNWAVQVGAFGNQGLATAATAAARDQARTELAAARPAVSGVRQGSSTLYRARLTGLSRDAAAQACERLSRGRTNCMVISPDAQS